MRNPNVARTAPSPRLPFAIALASVLSCAVIAATASAQGFLDQFQTNSFGGSAGFGGGSDQPVSVSSQFTAATADRPAVLVVTGRIKPGWHVYSLNQGKLPSGLGPQKTTLALADSADYKLLGGFRESPLPHERLDTLVFEGLTLKEHENEVTWYAPIEFAPGVDPSSVTVNAKLALQACHDQEGCVPQSFEIAAQVGNGVPIGALDLTTPIDPPTMSLKADVEAPPAMPAKAAPTPDTAGAAYALTKIELGKPLPVSYVLLISLLGGLILNVMPCVLPVIGLKVMSFIDQAGHSRAKAFALNLWYSLGILSVFLVLAVLVAFFGATFGSQFGDARFNVVMSSIVFALALSMLGLWEIPIPGFAGGSKAQEMAKQEGAMGAFLKGVLTTILATPCTGPYVGTALGWTVRQPPAMTFAVFTALGLGMAFPYLLLGTFPSLIRFLPRPGAWMETFKHLMGFVLVGTVVWLMSSLSTQLVLPTVAALLSVAIACWVYGRTPITASKDVWVQTYVLCGAIIAGGATFSYGYLLPDVFEPRYQSEVANAANDQTAEAYQDLVARLISSDPEERDQLLRGATVAQHVTDDPYQDFTLNKLGQVAVEQGRTVLVDFSADWCINCKFFEKTVLHSERVEAALDESEIVTMYGDFTDKPQWLDDTIKALGGNGVPVIAVFPGSDPYRPIVFRGSYTQDDLLEAINEANSRRSPQNPRTATNPFNASGRKD